MVEVALFWLSAEKIAELIYGEDVDFGIDFVKATTIIDIPVDYVFGGLQNFVPLDVAAGDRLAGSAPPRRGKGAIEAQVITLFVEDHGSVADVALAAVQVRLDCSVDTPI